MLGTYPSIQKNLNNARCIILNSYSCLITRIPSSILFGNQARVWTGMALMSSSVATSETPFLQQKRKKCGAGGVVWSIGPRLLASHSLPVLSGPKTGGRVWHTFTSDTGKTIQRPGDDSWAILT